MLFALLFGIDTVNSIATAGAAVSDWAGRLLWGLQCAASALLRAQVGEEVLGTAAKVEVSKESTTIVGDGSSEESVKARVRQIKNMITETEQDYEKEKLNERVARLSGGVAIIQVWFGISHCPHKTDAEGTSC